MKRTYIFIGPKKKQKKTDKKKKKEDIIIKRKEGNVNMIINVANV